MKKFRLRDYLPVLIMLLCAAIFGVLLATGVMDLDTVPQLVADRPVLAVLVVLGLYVLKGFSGVVVYNALVVVVSMVLPLPAALAVNGVGTAVCLSISYAMGRFTKTESLESVLDRHPKIKRYFSATQEYGFAMCFAIHMLGLNMEVLGLLLGMLRVDYLTYLAGSWLAIARGWFVWSSPEIRWISVRRCFGSSWPSTRYWWCAAWCTPCESSGPPRPKARSRTGRGRSAAGGAAAVVDAGTGGLSARCRLLAGAAGAVSGSGGASGPGDGEP